MTSCIVRHDHHRAAFVTKRINSSAKSGDSCGVQMLTRLIEQLQRNVDEQGTGHQQAAPLTARNRVAACAKLSVYAVGQGPHPGLEAHPGERRPSILFTDLSARNSQIFEHSRAEDVRVLERQRVNSSGIRRGKPLVTEKRGPGHGFERPGRRQQKRGLAGT